MIPPPAYSPSANIIYTKICGKEKFKMYKLYFFEGGLKGRRQVVG